MEARPEAPASEPPESKSQDPVTVLFTRMDIDKDGRISPREARGLLLELFTRLDRNQDGYLDKEELQAALERYPGLQVK
jgi:Ca2+-binding EF-hand superfamily protein